MAGRKKFIKSRTGKNLANFKASIIVDAAKKISNPLPDLQKCKRFCHNNLNLQIQCMHGTNLDQATKEWVFQLTKANMMEMYKQSSWGWNESAKRSELTDKDAWYLLVKNLDEKLLGFVHFRYEVEYNSPVIYCYELQIDEKIQRNGVGQHLTRILLVMACHMKFSKVMLTVFKYNQQAYEFYTKHLGFRIDQTSPSRCDDDSQCYEILSKKANENELNLLQEVISVD